MTPDELPAFLDALSNRAGDCASPAVLAIARTYQKAVKSNLQRTSHPPFTRTPAPPGSFPSKMTGRLQASVTTSGGGGDPVATASVAPHTIYAAVQEYGHTMHAHNQWGRPMRWYNAGSWWAKYEVHVPARPYMRPTIAECIGNGSLTAAAMAAFEVAMWG